jgi:hypothetical protein
VKEKDEKRGGSYDYFLKQPIMNNNLRKPITIEDFSSLKTILGVLSV